MFFGELDTEEAFTEPPLIVIWLLLMPFSCLFAEYAVTEPPLIVSESLLIPVPDWEEAFTEPPLIVSESLSIPVPDVEDAVTEPPLIVSRLVLMAGYCSEYTVKLPLLFGELFIVGKEKGPIIKVDKFC